MAQKDKYDRMSPEEFNGKLIKAIGGFDQAKKVIEKERLIVNRKLFEAAEEKINLPPLERFSAREAFVQGDVSGVRYAFFGKRFTRLFLPVVEHNVKESCVRRLLLRKRTSTVRMLPDLGKRKFACIPLAHVHAFLALPPVMKGSANYLFFSTAIDGKMWPVMADRSPDGWWVECPEYIRGQMRFDRGRIIVPKYREL